MFAAVSYLLPKKTKVINTCKSNLTMRKCNLLFLLLPAAKVARLDFDANHHLVSLLIMLYSAVCVRACVYVHVYIRRDGTGACTHVRSGVLC